MCYHFSNLELVCENEKLENIHFSPGILVKISKKLKPKLTLGPDGYSPFFLKQIISSIAVPLCMMYQSFMSVGIIPLEWKSAIIVPIFKKGASSDPSNYRPISLTSVFSKLMERCIVIEMLSYLSSRNLISKQQHGFLKRKSTTTNLLESFNDWFINIEGRTSQTIAYIRYDTYRHLPLPRFPLTRGNFSDWAVHKGYIAYFSLRMRQTAIFPFPV